MPLPQVFEERQSRWSGLAPHERVHQRTAEQIVNVPQNLEEIVEVVRLVTQERVQWIDGQMVEVTFPQLSEDIDGEFKVAPQEQFVESVCGRPCSAV